MAEVKDFPKPLAAAVNQFEQFNLLTEDGMQELVNDIRKTLKGASSCDVDTLVAGVCSVADRLNRAIKKEHGKAPDLDLHELSAKRAEDITDQMAVLIKAGLRTACQCKELK